jgi:hypothetical protein
MGVFKMFKISYSILLGTVLWPHFIQAQTLPVTEEVRLLDGQKVVTKTVVEPTKAIVSSSDNDIEQRYISTLPQSEKARGEEYLRLNRELENAQIRLRLAEFKKEALNYENEIRRTQDEVKDSIRLVESSGNVNIVGANSLGADEPRQAGATAPAQKQVEVITHNESRLFESFEVLGIFRDVRLGVEKYVAQLQVDDQIIEVNDSGKLFDDVQIKVNQRFVEVLLKGSSEKLTFYPVGS